MKKDANKNYIFFIFNNIYKLKKNMIFILVLCLIILIILLCLYGYNKKCSNQRYSNQIGLIRGGGEDTFKNNNDPSGWQLYTLSECKHCIKQKKNLHGFNTYVEFERGNNIPLVNNINGKLYPRDKIKGFPFWYNSKTKEEKLGEQNVCNLIPKLC